MQILLHEPSNNAHEEVGTAKTSKTIKSVLNKDTKANKVTNRNIEVNKIYCGNNLELIKNIPDKTVNLVITSPPYYKQRNYGGGMGNEESIEEYIEELCRLFKECVRVTTDNGSIVFNLGDKYQDSSLLLAPYRFAIEILKREQVKLVNNITWTKLNPTPRQFRRRLVSSTEPFFHFVKSNKYYYNIDSFLEHLDMAKKTKHSNGNGNGNGIGKKYFELIETSSLSETEKKMARQELTDVIHEVKSNGLASFRMKIRGIHSLPFGGQEGGRLTQINNKGFTIIRIYNRAMKRDVIETAVESIKASKHPAIYPECIIQELLKLLTKKGDVVLDPYIGSGTTAVACKKLERNYIGFEINSDYCENAIDRIKNDTSTLPI